jgi:hypothetical protein
MTEWFVIVSIIVFVGALVWVSIRPLAHIGKPRTSDKDAQIPTKSSSSVR